MATHDRTAEVLTSLRAAFSSASSTALLLDAIVFIDEAPGERARTELALADLPKAPIVLHGDGTTYWTRALRALLDEALKRCVDYIVHLNTDVTISAPIDVLLAPMRADPQVAAVVGVLVGDVSITGYRPTRPWFPFFRSVEPGNDAAILPGSYVAYRASALRSERVDLSALDQYRHGWGDVELSLQLRDAGYRLATVRENVGFVEHKRYYQRHHSFERYGGSLLRYIRECPTAPCFADTRRVGSRLFGPFWPVMLRVYIPVAGHWLRYRYHRAAR